MIEKLAKLCAVSPDLAAVLTPLFIIYLLIVLIAIVDLIRNWKERSLRLFWTLLILFLTPVGPVLYLLIGRRSAHETNT